MQGKFVSNPERFLNKTVLFDTSKVDKEKIIERILENIPGDNDDIYLYLRREDGT